MDYYKPGALKQLKFTLSPFWRTELSQHHSAKTCSPFSGSRGRLLLASGFWWPHRSGPQGQHLPTSLCFVFM